MTRTQTEKTEKLDLLQGTLDMMVLRTLSAGRANGYEIARAIERLSDDVLAVDHGSLYPALHRLERSGLVVAKWEISATNRRAPYHWRKKARTVNPLRSKASAAPALARSSAASPSYNFVERVAALLHLGGADSTATDHGVRRLIRSRQLARNGPSDGSQLIHLHRS